MPYYNLTDLSERYYVEAFLGGHPDVDTLFYMGHGDVDRLYGMDLFWAMIDLANDGYLQGKLCWTMACLSANQLGPDAIKHGAPAYFGHTVEYQAAFPDPSHDYLADWVDYVLSTPKALVSGQTAGEAFDTYKAAIGHYIDMYTEFAQDLTTYPNSNWSLQATQSNLDYAVLLGDTNAKLSSSLAPGPAGS